MATKPPHLVERAAERLWHWGLLDPSNADSLPTEYRGVFRPARPAAFSALRSDATADDIIAPEPAAGLAREPGPSRLPPRSIIGKAVLQRAGMVDWAHGPRQIMEEFRLAQQQLLRAALATTAQPGLANLVMVTSARPGEGKSFISLNLACGIALQGDYDVLLIDCDPAPQSLSQTLGLAESAGILDLAAHPGCSADDLILGTEVENLSVLPVGSERARSSALFACRYMAQLLQRLGGCGTKRVVILDAAPSLSTSDPAALASAVGHILMVVQAERTQRDEVEKALELLQACPSIMLVLNKAHQFGRFAFGAGPA